MKLICASVLSAILLASGVGATSRQAVEIGDDRYHVGSIGVGWGGTTSSPDQTSFKLTATHQEADTGSASAWAGTKTILLFKTCPHGAGPDQAVANPINPNYLGEISTADGTGISWIENVVSPTTTGTAAPYTTEWTFRVDATIATATSGIYTATVGTPDTGVAEFCIFFGVGDQGDNEVYGFMEATVKANFQFNGVFVVTSFETQAYDPVTGAKETTRTYSSKAFNCSPDAPAVGTNPIYKVRPGMPVCIQICPDGTGSEEVRVTAVNSLIIQENSNPLTTAPNGPTQIVGGVTTVIDCNPGSTTDAMGNAVSANCCKVMFVLAARYFPSSDDDTPTMALFEASGDVDLVPRARRLQEASTEQQNAPLSGSAEFELLPEGYEESSSSALGLAAAAVGAVGAAFLI